MIIVENVAYFLIFKFISDITKILGGYMSKIEMGVTARGFIEENDIDFFISTSKTRWISIKRIVDALFKSGEFKEIFIYLYANPVNVRKEFISGLPLGRFTQTVPNAIWRLRMLGSRKKK